MFLSVSNDQVEKKTKIRRNWELYLQLDKDTSKGSVNDDRLYLKSHVNDTLGKHVYKENGNSGKEYVAICKAHDNCEHLIKIGPGDDDYFKIMVYGNHSETIVIKPEHGIHPVLIKRITDAANLNVTTKNIIADLKTDESINEIIPTTNQVDNFVAYLKRKKEITAKGNKVKKIKQERLIE
jgi:hypothetical protein